MRTTRAAIALFIAVAALGPLYTAQGDSPLVNVISELAAQNTPRNHLMAATFVALGAGLVYDGAKAFHRSLLKQARQCAHLGPPLSAVRPPSQRL